MSDRYYATGRRKASVARVWLQSGDGKFEVNKRPYEKYFTEERDRLDLLTVLKKTNTQSSVDVHVNVHGGGFTGQAGAIVLGLGRALKRYDPSLEHILRDNNFLTRDPVTVLPVEAQIYYKRTMSSEHPRYKEFEEKYKAVKLAQQSAAESELNAADRSGPSGVTFELKFLKFFSELLDLPSNQRNDFIPKFFLDVLFKPL